MPRALLLIVLLLASPASARCPASATTESFQSSRYDVGVRTLMLEDTTRTTAAHAGMPEKPSRLLVTEVWYPIERGTTGTEPPVAKGGPFPLVVNSHGLTDFRTGEGYIAAHLASRGYVVASPDFPLTNIATPGGPDISDFHNQPGDVSFIIDELLKLGKTRGSWLHKAINRKRIGAMGLSLGGGTTLLVTYHPTLRDPRIRAALPMAPTACFFREAFYRKSRAPLLVMQGDEDIVVPLATNGRVAFDSAVRSSRTLVSLVRGTHTAFVGLNFPPAEQSYDIVACATLVGVENRGNFFEGLGGPENGIETEGCALPCVDPPPNHPPMTAMRQHEISRAVAAAFFDSTLRGSRPARCFISEHLAAENADVMVETARGRK